MPVKGRNAKPDAAEDAADKALEASAKTLKHGAQVAAEVSSKAEGLLSKVASGAKAAATAVAREVLMVDENTPKKTSNNPFRKDDPPEEASPNAASPRASLDRNRSARVMSPEEKAAAAAAAAAAASASASEFEELMSDRLPDINTKLDFDEAKAEWKRAAVTDINGQYISVCGSGYEDLEPLGPGIGLWFRTLKSLALYFFLMTALMAFVIYNAV